jgi:hypothetical protein
MKNVKNWKKQSKEKRQTPSAIQENKRIKSGLTPQESEPFKSKPDEPRMLTN